MKQLLAKHPVIKGITLAASFYCFSFVSNSFAMTVTPIIKGVTVSVANNFIVADKFYLATCFVDATTGEVCDSALNTDSDGVVTETYQSSPKQIVFRVFAPIFVLKQSDFATNCPQIKYWRLSSKYFIWSTDPITTTSNHLNFRISIDTNSQVTCTLSQ
jgi:hypothetical protein